MKVSRFIMIIYMSVLLSGCGGGGNSATSTIINTNNNISTYNVTGSDSTGATYTGTMQYVNDGQTIIDGLTVKQKRYIRILSKVGIGTENPYIETEYFNLDGSIYKVAFTSGLTGLATTHYIFPSVVNIGDSGIEATIAYSDGSIHTSTWQASDGGNGNIIITHNSFANGVLHQQNINTITPGKVTIAMKKIIHDFPSLGVTTTLFGNLL